jgi:hypothetical protein
LHRPAKAAAKILEYGISKEKQGHGLVSLLNFYCGIDLRYL